MYIEKIKRFEDVTFTITQKLHGTSAGVLIFSKEQLEQFLANPYTANYPIDTWAEIPNDPRFTQVGDFWVGAFSKNRVLGLGKDDNFGFAAFVKEHAEYLVELCGHGAYQGEWVGPGINSGEGLKSRRFFFFKPVKNLELLDPSKPISIVPTLALNAPLATLGSEVEKASQLLLTQGSQVPETAGFMRTEGIVIAINGGPRFKHVFESETTQWKGPSKPKGANQSKIERPIIHSHLMHPLRLEKLFSRDSSLIEGFPANKPVVVKLYIEDLLAEGFDVDLTGHKPYQEFFEFVTAVGPKPLD